jgi:xanthine dehydrogenase YagS FAD-binding subunit
MNPFDLAIPDDLGAATKAGAGKDATFKAAGIDLVDRLKERVTAPKTVVDLLGLGGEMLAVRDDETSLHLGALLTLQQVADAEPTVRPALMALREACGEAATPQVRRRATLGGNLLQRARCWYLRSAAFGCLHGGDGPTCMAREGEHRYHAILGGFDCIRIHPSNAAVALCALDALATVEGPEGRREIPIHEVWPRIGLASLPEHTLAPGEVLVSLRIPTAAPGTRSAYRESREKVTFDWPTTSAAVRLEVQDGVIRSARICLGAVAPVPWISEEAAKVLVGGPATREQFAKAAEAAFARAQPLPQNAYKVQVGRAVLIDALTATAE